MPDFALPPPPPPSQAAYTLLFLAGVLSSALLWNRVARPAGSHVLIYVGALLGLLVGAKLGFALAELPFIWGAPDLWTQLLWGKTILGGLLGGYAGVELGKRACGVTAATGDGFALTAPFALALGRLGCALRGCCAGKICEPAWYAQRDSMGVFRYPAQLAELVFHLAALGALWSAHTYIVPKHPRLKGQLFHLYLMTYGVYRFLSEFFRDTPRYAFGLSPYQVLALLLMLFAFWRFQVRARENSLPVSPAQA